MIVLILVNIVLILYLYFKYYRLPENISGTNIEVKDMDSTMLRLYK